MFSTSALYFTDLVIVPEGRVLPEIQRNTHLVEQVESGAYPCSP